MLKHVQLGGLRTSLMRSGDGQKADTVSINSTMSFSSLHEPALSSRSSSYTSLNETQSSTGSASVPDTAPTTTVKVYTRCLRPDLEYKTVCVNYTTTCRHLVDRLLSKYRMKHRDPNLFFLTMEVATRCTGASVKTILVLDDESCPAQLQACYPRTDSRFTIRMHHGGLIRIYDSVLMSGSKYKSLLVSERTTVDELIQLLLQCYNSTEDLNNFNLHEECPPIDYSRKLHGDDYPLLIQQEWPTPDDYIFSLKRRNSITLTSSTSTENEPSLRQTQSRWNPVPKLHPHTDVHQSGENEEKRLNVTTLSLRDFDNVFRV